MAGHNGELRKEDPEIRRASFWAGIITHDLREDLPPEVVATLESGDDFWWTTPGRHEPMQTRARRFVAGDSMAWDAQSGYFGAKDRGVLNPGETYQDFGQREVVTVYSEHHGSHEFAYDGTTGERFLPRGDVSHITPRTGDNMIALGAIAERFLGQES